jgi:hypothetical protein
MDRLTTLLELAGIGCLVAAAFLVSVTLGLAVGGVGMMVLAWRLAP